MHGFLFLQNHEKQVFSSDIIIEIALGRVVFMFKNNGNTATIDLTSDEIMAVSNLLDDKIQEMESDLAGFDANMYISISQVGAKFRAMGRLMFGN